jgi:hypothetical protein
MNHVIVFLMFLFKFYESNLVQKYKVKSIEIRIKTLKLKKWEFFEKRKIKSFLLFNDWIRDSKILGYRVIQFNYNIFAFINDF